MPTNCLYCQKNKEQEDLLIEICNLNVSTVYLFKEQTYKGRCVVAYNKHGDDLHDLDDVELLAYMNDVNKVAIVLKNLFNAYKINYGSFSDDLKHLHFHLVPKYYKGPDFGGMFKMNPQFICLTESQYSEMAKAIKEELLKVA